MAHQKNSSTTLYVRFYYKAVADQQKGHLIVHYDKGMSDRMGVALLQFLSL